MKKKVALLALFGIAFSFTAIAQKYSDGRPEATLRMDVKDYGIVLRYGDGPEKCDILGARDVWVFEANGRYYMHYDAAGPKGWLSALAISKDLVTWEKKGPILDFGQPGEDDSKSAAYGVTFRESNQWHLFYLGTPNVSPAPDLIPSFPYLTLKAKSNSPSGPWIKQKEVLPFRPKADTYYSLTASPGHVVQVGDEYLQFFSSTTRKSENPCVQRTLGIARTKDLDGSWTVDSLPLVPIEEQVENSSLYYEENNKTWFLFTNHIGIEDGKEYTDAIWVYWSKDLNSWDSKKKAIVLDGENCSWSKKCIGLPSVVQVGDRLALFYDAPGGESISHMKRNVGLAWLDLPLTIPTDEQLGLHSEGGPWQFYPAKDQQADRQKVLLIGNSVMNGFKNHVIDSLKGIADVDYWLTPKHLNSEFLFADLKQVVTSQQYDVIQFNIGLHGWPEGRIKKEDYVPLLEKYVNTLQENAKNANLIWASITPVTEQGKAELNKEINPTIARRNKQAAEVMQRHEIEINDLYGLVVNQLHLAKLDRFHWLPTGYQLMANQSLQFIDEALEEQKVSDYLSTYNVVWESPSTNSMGSMPAGNGDIGINLWVEEHGDLVFYLSKTDAWSENARLLKLGKIRIALSPNPFKTGNPYRQELVLDDGVIQIDAGEQNQKISLAIWVDAHDPVVEIDIKSQIPIMAKVSSEPWRTELRELKDAELHSAYGLREAWVHPDTLINLDDGVLCMHRNKYSIWEDNLSLQGLEDFTNNHNDPLLHNTFGSYLRSAQMIKTDLQSLQTTAPLKQFSISAYAFTNQTGSVEDYSQQITQLAQRIETKSKAERLKKHTTSFWNRSYIHVSTDDAEEKDKVFNVSRGYALQRYINACAGRGESPIKFNGSIFTVDTKNLPGKYNGFDADYRQWGGPYWWQNTRLPYWSMLEAGDFDLMLPLFKMYKDALEIRRLATQKYYQHEGAFYPETMRHWGTYAESNYGWDRTDLPLGMTKNLYIRYYWQGGLELSLMMLDYYAFTKDDQTLKEAILPVVTEIITFFDQHWERDDQGKIWLEPAMALETYNSAVNPLPEIVGINKVCSELLRLPESLLTPAQRQQYSRLINELPEIPTREVDGKTLLAPADSYSGKQNVENPELYAIFPYRRFGIGKDHLELAKRTFDQRAIKHTGGWQQNAIKAAYLGLSNEAAELTAQNFNTSNNHYRFPVMWGPNYDWIPDQDHGSVAMIALQRMLLQYDGDDLFLFPAWPKTWDVDFKLNAPYNTQVKATFKTGEISHISVTPQKKKEDLTIIK